MTIFIIAFATCIATLLGGTFALRLKDKLHLILGFSAGAVIGVAFFDLMPEAIDLGTKIYTPGTVVSIIALGFLAYLVLDRIILFHTHIDEQEGAHDPRGTSGATTLSIHSFLDGVGIGLAFHVSPAVGIIVAAAVLAHDFSDGINTVNFILKHNGTQRYAFRWLLVDALAPVVGVISTLFVTVSETQLGLLLALFSGFFLYIGASDLVPESYHAHPMRWTTISTLLGAACIYVIISLTG
ncbi:MAG TPA: ZIP family metal transporter [Candidatus Paceibacterota bacterium]|nr:ZIP family metal transporter [Candidatus Paceibacterota bacterium]